MSTDNWQALPGAVAGASFAGKIHRFCKLSGVKDFEVIPVTAVGELAIGVAYDDVPNIGESLTVANRGVVKVEASAALAAGVKVATAADGRAAAAATGNIVLGEVLSAATAAGDIISVQLLGPFVSP